MHLYANLKYFLIYSKSAESDSLEIIKFSKGYSNDQGLCNENKILLRYALNIRLIPKSSFLLLLGTRNLKFTRKSLKVVNFILYAQKEKSFFEYNKGSNFFWIRNSPIPFIE